MKKLNWLATMACALVLGACGGGGGSGSAPFGGTSGSGGTGTGTGTGGTTVTYSMTVAVQRGGTAVSDISSTETVQAVATVTSSTGASVEGVVVSFAESGPSLVEFAPAVGTALTNASGQATIDLGAASPSGTGATTITASATVSGNSVSATKSIQISAGAVTPGVSPVVAAINFVGSSSGGTAIVIKGAGGSGRSESAILTFKVVDASNAPINAAVVNFSLNADSGGASLLQSSGTSNSEGLVTVTVSSGTTPASIVVKATAANTNPAITAQSDTLLVSNGVAIAEGFEITSSKYNLDGRLTGDTATLTARVRDASGNPVADGVAVSFQTDFGVVATSAVGGCLTVNGVCTVEYRVQDPRGNGLATVAASVRVGESTVLRESLQLNLSAASGVLAPQIGGVDVGSLRMTTCKQVFALELADGQGRAAPAGTVISTGLSDSNVTVSIKDGSPVPDQLDPDFGPLGFGIEVDLTSADLVPACNPGGTGSANVFTTLRFTTPGGIVYPRRIDISYPR